MAGWLRAPVRIDLARSANTDFAQLVLTIRAALAELGRPLPAFDLALRRYGEQQHPGESLEEYLRRADCWAGSARRCRSRCRPLSRTSPRPCCYRAAFSATREEGD
ncbi:hypothetical protein AB0K02_27700 [Streptomyces sp. NPDC049597]|uniref:hypothetical protein n=1 Tax=Streptomyces sp. NPDC049597 TaxID=3155276 RepID=UPI0034217E86